MFVAMILGTATGVLASLVPGLHMGLALALLMAMGMSHFLGNGFAIAFIATAAGASIYTRRLSAVYHPSAGSGDVASLDPALRLTSQGRGPDALRLMVLGTDMAWPLLALILLLLGATAIFGINAAKTLDTWLRPLAIPLILFWVAATALRSQRRFATLMGFGLIGLYGYVVLHHPGLKGNQHTMAPLMAGLFGIPIMLAVLCERITSPVPAQSLSPKIRASLTAGMLGSAIGAVTGFFAGLGAGSLVSFLADSVDSDEDYLLMSSASEASNDLLALLLILVAGMGRSGEAILLGRVAHQPAAGQVALIVAMVAIAAMVGRYATFKLEKSYTNLIQLFPSSFWATLVLVLAMWQVWLVGEPLLAYSLTFAGVCLSLWARSLKLPLQVSFAGIALPLVIQGAGAAPALNSVLFGM